MKDYIQISIPKGILALSILSSNSFSDEEEFREDGYVYKDGVRLRKWFSYQRGWKYFWKPCLNNIPRLENVYHRLCLRSSRNWANIEKMMKHIRNVVPKTVSHGENTFKVCSDYAYSRGGNTEYFQYSIYERGSYSSDWVSSEEYEKDKNVSLGNEFHKLSRLHMRPARYDIGDVLSRAFEAYIHGNKILMSKKEGTLIELHVNGRTYIYRLVLDTNSALRAEKYFWSGEDREIVSL
jgi:hypothetical protein